MVGGLSWAGRDDGSFPLGTVSPLGHQSRLVHMTRNGSWESDETSSGGQILQASACLPFADVLLVKASRVAKPRHTGWESRLHPDGRSNEVLTQRGFLPG